MPVRRRGYGQLLGCTLMKMLIRAGLDFLNDMRFLLAFVVAVALVAAGCLSGAPSSGPPGEPADDNDPEQPEPDTGDGMDGDSKEADLDNASSSGPRVETQVINETLGGVGYHLILPIQSVGGCAGTTCQIWGSTNLTANVTGIVAELAWNPVNALMASFNLRMSWRDAGGDYVRERTSGSPPLKMTLQDMSQVDRSSYVDAFGWPDQATTDDAGVYFAQSQPVTLYISTFYDKPVEQDFTAIPD